MHDSIKIEDKWGSYPGGELLSHNFINNPQYCLKIEEKTQIQVKAKCEGQHNVSLIALVSGKDARETEFDNLANNMSSGQYFTSFAYFQAVLEPNSYTLILSSQDEDIVHTPTLFQ